MFGAGPLHPGETPETVRYRAQSWDGTRVFHDDWATSPPTSHTVSYGTSLLGNLLAGWMSSGQVGDMHEIITSPQSLNLHWNGAIVLVVARIGLG